MSNTIDSLFEDLVSGVLLRGDREIERLRNLKEIPRLRNVRLFGEDWLEKVLMRVQEIKSGL